MKKLVSESLYDVLKPKNLIGIKYYTESSFSSFPNIIIELLEIFKTGNYLVKMLYNTMLTTGDPNIFERKEMNLQLNIGILNIILLKNLII